MKFENFSEEFNRAVEEWRSNNGVAENDAVLLLLDLFRIHQKHWDAIRHQEMAAFGDYRQDINKLSENAKEYQKLTEGLLHEMHRFQSFKETFWTMCWPIGSICILGVVIGITIGRFWL